MSQVPNIDGVLITCGDRLFYPGNRVVKVKPQPKLNGDSARQRAAAIRERIEATVVRRAPQVMVKVTGGGRGMKAIAAHFRYISKNGRLDVEDERGETMRGKDALPGLADDWRFGGTLIEDIAEPGQRREAFNIMLYPGRDCFSACGPGRRPAFAWRRPAGTVPPARPAHRQPHVTVLVERLPRPAGQVRAARPGLQRLPALRG